MDLIMIYYFALRTFTEQNKWPLFAKSCYSFILSHSLIHADSSTQTFLVHCLLSLYVFITLTSTISLGCFRPRALPVSLFLTPSSKWVSIKARVWPLQSTCGCLKNGRLFNIRDFIMSILKGGFREGSSFSRSPVWWWNCYSVGTGVLCNANRRFVHF